MNYNNKAAISSTRKICKRLTLKMKLKNQLKQREKLVKKKIVEQKNHHVKNHLTKNT